MNVILTGPVAAFVLLGNLCYKCITLVPTLHIITSARRTPLETTLLECILACSFVLSSILLVLSGIAFIRRKTTSIFLLTAAFATLLGHSVITILMLEGFVSNVVHHLVEHALVFVQSGLVLAAIYYARTIEKKSMAENDVSEQTK